MQDLARLNSLAEAEIELLRSEGIEPSLSDIIEINALAWAIETPQSRLLLARGVPVFVDAETPLWPLTLLASDWFSREGCKLRNSDAALGFAMAHCYKDASVFDLSGDAAAKRVKLWFRRLRCTHKAYIEAVNQVLLQETVVAVPPLKGEPGLTAGEFSAFLASACGGDVEFWERRCAVGYANAMLYAVAMQNRVDNKPVSNDPRMAAERALGLKLIEIKKAHQNAGGGDGH